VVASRDTGEGEYSKRLKGEARSDVSSPSSSSSSSSSSSPLPPPPPPPQSTGSDIVAGASCAAAQGRREPWVENNYFK
jgi:hypothetical protein